MEKYCFMKIVYSIVLSFLALQLYAVPARRSVFLAKMSDGTFQYIRFCGDENRSFYLSEDGYIVEPNKSGTYYIRTQNKPEDLPVVRSVRSTGIGHPDTAPIRPIGSPKIPVILVNFSDEKMTVAGTDSEINEYYDRFCNGTRDGVLYKDAGSYGAVRDYFAQQSDSLFLPDFKIIGPVTLSKPMAYYGENSGASKDIHFTEFCKEALSLAMEIAPDIATDFDNDGNGTVDMAFYIYAGLPESDPGVTSDAIWPKEFLSSMNVNDITISVMACCSELSRIRSENRISGVGTMCHEVAHALGLPDQYDVNGKELGMSFWSLMDSGNYCGNGYSPCGMTGYERDFLNWRKLRTLTESCTVRLRPIEDGGISCKVVNENNPDEYYVLDNRTFAGWDGQAIARLGHGMLVTHVDYDKTAWTTNRLNTNGEHQRMSFIPANNAYIGNYNAGTSANLVAALAGQPYPGSTQNGSLTDWSEPASTVFTGGFMSKAITQIKEMENGDIVFKFMPKGTLPAPEALAVKELTDVSLTLEWTKTPEAECYAVNIYGVDADGNMTETPVHAIDSLYATSYTVTFPSDHYKELVAEVMAMADKYEDSDFSMLRMTVPASGIKEVDLSKCRDAEVYTLQGFYLGKSKDVMSELSEGIYILRVNGQTQKVIIH